MIIILNKIDKGILIDEQRFAGFKVLKLSVKQDISPLVDELKNLLDTYAKNEDPLLISTRQIDAVKKALQNIEAAQMPLDMGELEIFAFHLNEATKAVGSITRPMESSELLDKMFGEFCLGK